MLISSVATASEQPESTALPGIAGHMAILIDPSDQLTLADILTPDRQANFSNITKDDINLGYNSAAVWLRLLLPATANQKGILSLSPNFLDAIDVYVAPPGVAPEPTMFTRHAMGDHRPLPMDGISDLVNAVPLEFARDQTSIVYIRILNKNSFTQLSLSLDTVESRALWRSATNITYGVWFGGMSVLFITQLVFFCFVRKSEYLLLALSTLGVILIYFGNLGLSYTFLFRGDGAANDIFIGFNAWAGLTATALAYSSILDLRHNAPRVRYFNLFMAAAGVIGVGFALMGKTVVFGPYGSALGVIGGLVTMVQGLRQASFGSIASQLRAAAFCLIGVGASITLLQRLGVGGLPTWTFHAYGVSALLQTLLLTAALAVRLRDVENQNRKIQTQALHDARAAEQAAARQVEERTRELVEARQTAEAALDAEMQSQLRQVRFLEVVSHQYRTPLAAIRSNIDSIGLEIPADHLRNRHRVERIRRAISRLVEILEVSLAQSRLQGPSFRPKMESLHLGPIVRTASQRARDLLNDAEINLTISGEAAETPIMADAGMLELAMINLIENAVKYTALKDPQPIVLSLDKREADLVISVTDRGIGIPADELPHIFENAVRGSNAESVEGSGLGLFLVARITAAHGGRTEITSTLGEGTTIRIVLPVATR